MMQPVLLFLDATNPFEGLLVAFGILTPLIVGYALGYFMGKDAEKKKYYNRNQ